MATRSLLIVVAILASGCADDLPRAGGDTSAPPMQTCSDPCILQVDAPRLQVGTTWHYRSRLTYDVATQQNVTVARADQDGYLFAGTSKEDLVGEAVWGRGWFGPHSLGLQDLEETSSWISFPLFDGKTWVFSPEIPASPERTGRPERIATATAKSIATPTGAEDGFAIDVDAEGYRFHAEYAPSVGYFTLIDSTFGQAQGDRLELTSVTKETGRLWFERGAATGTSAGEPRSMDVPTGFDSLLASAGSAAGGRIVVAPPPSAASAPWVYEGKGKETWDSRTMPATPGKWTLTVTDPPDCKGCSYLRALLVRWIQP